MSKDLHDQHIGEDDLAALALGLLAGDTRADALAHVDTCAQCGAVLEQFSVGADGLLQFAQEIDPPIGFEVRVLDRMTAERPTTRIRRRQRAFLGAVAAAVAILVGITIGHFAIPQSSSPTSAQRATTTGAVLTATLSQSGQSLGTVVLFNKPHAWLLMTLHKVHNGSLVICRVKTVAGKSITVGSYWITSDSNSWAAKLPVPVADVRSVIITSPKGTVIATAPITA